VYIGKSVTRKNEPPTTDDCLRATDLCACSNLRKAARAVTQLYDDALRPLGIRSTQLPVLMTARAMQMVSVTELAERMVMDRTTLTRNLRPLVRDGLIELKPGANRRAKFVVLSARGERALTSAYEIWNGLQREVTKGLGEQRVDRLLHDLSAAVEFAHKR